ncbi:alpha-L-fucosidase [Chitinophaga sp. sic0106]|uniref:alpha-L-fucosidase n=1 Tax=Chitinophaga sp. sic0106 TaxID=2854785 RepID=UPI001C456539|nr:alpha-L-fucosidase [Chitinophaga sp. sic0106]MBV7529887.1 alpha-L-fucosidase [Chitinophaga sp. sic0106]
MNRRTLLQQLAWSVPALALSKQLQAAAAFVPAPKGPFHASWESLGAYKVPDWFRNAKFGMWAHWGPQCQPEAGDWYARNMYTEGSGQYKKHLEKYGHPSTFGFKDVIHSWKAEMWNPEELVTLYKNAGARYFMAMANHHDNLDLYKSKYQPSWNSTRVGPQKDIIGGWAKAARKNDLPFGVSVHAAHAWRWYESAQGADKQGLFAGVPYDGKLTKADGKGLWWEGLDPQELYAQNHPLSKKSEDPHSIHPQWHWGAGVYPPSTAYCENFYNRTIDLIDSYDPAFIYFDDTALPLWPVSDAGLRIAAHLYNKSIKEKGKLESVVFGKILDEQQRKCMVWDIERGQSNEIEPLPWQTDTCIGSWHYNREIYDKKQYKSAQNVIHILCDVVSKNGNLMLNIPVRGNGTIDEQERSVVEEIGRWMALNSEAIYDTRPWQVFGEGPAMEDAAPLSHQGFNEGKGKPFRAMDIRFTTKGNSVYAIALGWPENNKLTIKSLQSSSHKNISAVTMLGTGQQLAFTRDQEGLHVTLPSQKPVLSYAFALKISG